MRIQYASDLHLELWLKTTFDETLEPKAPYLVLCGDVSTLNAPNLHAFLEYISERWKLIFWIPGNCEIWNYSNSVEISLQKMRDICSTYKNIKILYESTYLLKDSAEELLIVGTSLWHKPRDEVMLHYHNNIYVKSLPTPTEQQSFMVEHIKQVKYLEYIIKNSEYPLLICSYYSPFEWMLEFDWLQNPNSSINNNELEKLITYPILAWIVGHCHLSIEYTRRYFTSTGYQGSVLFISNPRGNPKQNPYYRTEAVLNLKPNLLEGFEPKIVEPPPIWESLNR